MSSAIALSPLQTANKAPSKTIITEFVVNMNSKTVEEIAPAPLQQKSDEEMVSPLKLQQEITAST